MRTATEIMSQLTTAGVFRRVISFDAYHGDDSSIWGYVDLAVIEQLENDQRFAQGGLHLLHKDVGSDRTEFRAHPGEIGEGSLQIVIDRQTGRFYADIDRFNPYSDVVNNAGHALIEVVPSFFRKIKRLFSRKKS